MRAEEKVQIYVTGGTFDKDYNFITGELYFTNTHLLDMMERGRCTIPLDIKTLMMIDSLDMGTEERKIIAYQCNRCDYSNIVITHGTDTMAETALYLSEHVTEPKTIVLTGAMIPYAFGTSSDGFFNMGSALAFAQALDPGVYIAMNGKYFHAGSVKKNKSTGYFISKRDI